jgi:hypothetical protein
MFQHLVEEPSDAFIIMHQPWKNLLGVILRIFYKYVRLFWETLLVLNYIQCSLPVFEHLLLEPHNEVVMDLLFLLCSWHACAKLRLHTSSTLQILKNTTKALGKQIRYWVKKTCSAFETRELPKEESARHRRRAAAASKPNPSVKGKSAASAPERGTTRGRGRGRGRPAGPLKGRSAAGSSKVPASAKGKNEAQAQASKLQKHFNLCTYKLHALGDYVATIARYGTTDNYSTQVVSRLVYLKKQC